MTQVSEAARTAAADDPAVAVDRRRPGRPTQASPALIPLLRGEYAEPLLEQPGEDGDGLGPLRGLAWGMGISAGLWGLIIWAVRCWA